MSGSNFPPTTDVFVGNLPLGVSDNDLRDVFGKYGKIASVMTKESTRGNTKTLWAFVRFPSADDAASACNEDGTRVYGNTIKVNLSRKDNQQRVSGGGPKYGQKGGGGGGARQGSGYSNQGKQRDGQRNNDAYGRKQDGWNSKPDILPNNPSFGQQQQPQQAESYDNAVADLSFQTHLNIMMTHVESPTDFWAQIVSEGSFDDMSKITEVVNTECVEAQPIRETPQPKKIYCARFSEDGMFYRCMVVKAVSETKSQVIYVDYGNGEIQDNVNLVALPPSLAGFKPQAERYRLLGLQSAYNDPDSMGFSQGVEQLRLLMGDQLCSAKVYSGAGYVDVIPIEVVRDDYNVNQEMLNLGFVEQQTNGNQGEQYSQQGGQWNSQGASSSAGDGGGGAQQNSVNTWQNSELRSAAGGGDGRMNSSQGAPSRTSTDMDLVLRQKKELEREVVELQKQLTAQREYDAAAFHKQEQEMNSAVLELATLKGKMKVTEQEFNSRLQLLEEGRITTKLKNLLGGVQKVKMLRKQFPTDSEIDDMVERGFKLVTNPSCRIRLTDTESIQEVQTALQAYKTTQDNIMECKDLASVTALVGQRDEARVQVNNTMKAFLAHFAQLPLQDRGRDLRTCRQSLLETHSSFLNSSPQETLDIQEAFTHYCNWKDQRKTEFQDARTETNTCHNAVNSALRLLQERLSLENIDLTPNPESHVGLDDLLLRFQSTINKEVEKTDMCVRGVKQNHAEDVQLLGTTLKALIAEIDAEVADISKIEELYEEWAELQKQISQWLQEKPDVAEIKTVRATVKNLKSKLRHKLADKQDLEEESEGSNDEVQQLEEELAHIRLLLHEAFVKEDALLASLSELHDQHFPELVLQYPELGIHNYASYNGLVKIGRSLDQYNAKVLPGTDKKSILRAQFCGKPVILKEYIIDDSLGVRKEDFLRRAVHYNSIINSDIMLLEALFFRANERQAYIQLPYFESNLVNFVANNPAPPSQSIHDILTGCLRGIGTLHDSCLVHGAIHPLNVFLAEDGQGLLAEFDFSKSLMQRAERVYISSNGLKFVAPEVPSLNQYTKASDMYSFGLLALWLHFPSTQFQILPSGVPNLPPQDDHNLILGLIVRLLSEQPANRPTAAELLEEPYFAHPAVKSWEELQPAKDDTLQLRLDTSRPKTSSPTLEGRSNGGILKSPAQNSDQKLPVQTEAVPDRSTVSAVEDTVATNGENSSNIKEDITELKESVQTCGAPEGAADLQEPSAATPDPADEFEKMPSLEGVDTSLEDGEADVEMETKEQEVTDSAAAEDRRDQSDANLASDSTGAIDPCQVPPV